DRIVDGTHQRDAAQQGLPLLQQGAAQQVGGEHARQQHHHDHQREPETGDIDAHQGLRRQEAGHEALQGGDQQAQHPDGDDQGNPDQQPGDEVLLDDAHAHRPVAYQAEAAGAGVDAAGAALSLLAGASALAAPLSAVALPDLAAPWPPEPLRKSVTYQPEPLSWKPAAVTCLAKVSWPHSGQTDSGASENFCSTSLAWPQALHL